MEKIKISDFVERFEALKTDEEKSEMMKLIIVNTYVPFNTKYIYSKLLADKCCYEHVTKTGEDGKPFNEKTGKIKKDSGLQYHLFWRSVIDLYTNLERTDSFVDDYDNLVRTGILPAIVSAIPKGEFDEFNRLCDYAVADLLYNTNSPEAFVSSQIERISTILGAFLNPLGEKLIGVFAGMNAEERAKVLKIAGGLLANDNSKEDSKENIKEESK